MAVFSKTFVSRPVIGEEVSECHDDTEDYEETVMVDMVREECDTLMVSQCDTEYTEECDQRCEETPGEECSTVMTEVCGEVTTTRQREECWTLYRMDCASHWVGEGENKVGPDSGMTQASKECLVYDFQVWEVIPESCVRRPYERCDPVPVSPSLECRRVPQTRCSPAPRRCPRSACRQVPWTFCSQVPRRTNCRMVEDTVPRLITRTRTVRVCDVKK